MTIRGSCEIHCMGLDSSFLHPLGGNEIEKGERVMNAKRWMTVVVCGCWMVSAALCLAAGAEETARPLLDKMLDAVMTNDYDSFVAEGTPEVKAGLTRQMLAGVNSQMAPRMKKGYDATYLGELKQQGCQVMLWKLTYKDGGDDTLARLALKEEKVAGFLLQSAASYCRPRRGSGYRLRRPRAALPVCYDVDGGIDKDGCFAGVRSSVHFGRACP